MADRRPLTPEDVLSFKSVTDAQITPDGELVAFVVANPYKTPTQPAESHIWTVPAEGGDPHQFTSGPRIDDTPRWSPDGQTMAFLSDRAKDGELQVYLMPRTGGEATRLTDVKGIIGASRSVSPMAWSPDGTRIAFLHKEQDSDDQRKHKEEGFDAVEFERNHRFAQLWVADVESGKAEWVSPPGLQIWEFSWAPNGEEFVVVASDLPYEKDWYTNRLAVFSTDGGQVRTVHFSKRQVARPVWSPDETNIAFLSSNFSDRGITPAGVFTVTVGGHVRDVCVDHVASVTQMAWSEDSRSLVTVGHEKGGYGIADVDPQDGERTSLWQGEAAISDETSTFSIDSHRNLAMVREDPAAPPDVWIARYKSRGVDWQKLTDLHPQAAELELGAAESIHWNGADGWDIQGWLIRPPRRFGDGPHPMITVPHGGPTGAALPSFHASNRGYQLLAMLGYAVFLPNFRGSTGWGLEFAESNIGDMGGKDWEDIQKGIDHCIDREIAIVDKLGIMGHSYGGYMAAWAVTQTDRFRAAIMSAGIADWRSFHGRTRISEWDTIHYGDADAWDADGLFRKFSPITHVKDVKTPTLILHGEDDKDVPVEQGYEFYRALNDLGAEVELVVFPREGHGIQERAHRLDYFQRIDDWFQKHIPR